MKRVYGWVVAVVLGSMAMSVHAQQVSREVLKGEAEVQAFMTRVMGTIGRGELDAAYAALAYYTVLPQDEIEAGLQASKAQRNEQFLARYGKSVGHDFISKKKLGKSMMRFVYIEKTERQALPWVFHFYLTDRGWVLSEFGWDGQAAALYVTE